MDWQTYLSGFVSGGMLVWAIMWGMRPLKKETEESEQKWDSLLKESGKPSKTGKTSTRHTQAKSFSKKKRKKR